MKFYFKSFVFTLFCAACLMMTAGSALAYQAGDILFRTRLISVMPNDDSGKIAVNGVDQPGSSGDVGVGSAMTIEVDFTYMVMPNFGIEVIVGTTNHELQGDGDAIGETNVLPPTFLAQYHFMPDGNIKPYAGIGLNYTLFYDSDFPGGDVTLSSSFGLAAQGGFDLTLNEKWFFNFDLKYIQMSTTAEIEVGNDKIEVDVDINPWVVGVGIGTLF